MAGRTTTHDLGSRYRVRIPFARSVTDSEAEEMREALASARFEQRHQYDSNPVPTESVQVTADAALIDVAAPIGGDHAPSDYSGKLSQAIGQWHQEHGPLDEPTREGGAVTVSSLDAAQLDADRDPPGTGSGPHTVLLAYPERPLTDREVAVIERAAPDGVVTETYVAIFDSIPLIGSSYPARHALGEFGPALPRLDQEHGARSPRFFETRYVGTVAAVDDAARETVASFADRQTPPSLMDTDRMGDASGASVGGGQ